MVAMGIVEFGFLLVSLRLLFFGAIEYGRHVEHGDDGEDFFGAF